MYSSSRPRRSHIINKNNYLEQGHHLSWAYAVRAICVIDPAGRFTAVSEENWLLPIFPTLTGEAIAWATCRGIITQRAVMLRSFLLHSLRYFSASIRKKRVGCWLQFICEHAHFMIRTCVSTCSNGSSAAFRGTIAVTLSFEIFYAKKARQPGAFSPIELVGESCTSRSYQKTTSWIWEGYRFT